MLEAQGITVRKLAYYFLLLLPLSAMTFVSVIRMDMPRDVQTDVITGMSVFLSAGCIGVVFFQNWETPEERLMGTTEIMRQLANLAEDRKAA